MSELQTVEYVMRAPEGVKVTQSIGSVLHGALMELLPSNYVEEWHVQQIRPYSQHVYFDAPTQELRWRISTLNEQAYQVFSEYLPNVDTSLSLRQKNYSLEIVKKDILKSQNYSDLTDSIFLSTKEYSQVDMQFVTSTSFKVNGSYAIYPSPDLLLKGLIRKWNTFYPKEWMEERDILEGLNSMLYVKGYQLSLQPFALEGIHVHAFRGKYQWGLKGNAMSKRLLTLLLLYGEYAGIGIKTALGMGGFRAQLKEWNHHGNKKEA